MTYAQLRRHLSTVAHYGDAGAPTSAFPMEIWRELRGAGCVQFVGLCNRWAIMPLGVTILSHRAPRRRFVRLMQWQHARSA